MNASLCVSESNECPAIAVESELDLNGDGDHVIVTLHIDKVGIKACE